VFIGSDSRGLFGHQCPACKGYWRSKAVPALWKLTCPYCGMGGETHQFLTPGLYLLFYGALRVALDPLRADGRPERFLGLSPQQGLALAVIGVAMACLLSRRASQSKPAGLG